jgi:ATP-binding cassette subfamily B protein
VERQAERAAFAKACAYLNYSPGDKWVAHIAAAATGVVAVALLLVLWLFSDLMVSRGRLPRYADMTPSQQDRFHQRWRSLDQAEVADRLEAVGRKKDDRSDDAEWQAFMRQAIVDRVGPQAVPPDGSGWAAYTDRDLGVLSLIVREDAEGRWPTPILAWVTRWNPWMWNYGGREATVFSPYLIGLLIVAVVLGLLAAGLTLLQRDMSARATIEAATRLRRAVYHHTFRLGTLAFRALGPSEAISLFTRHVEAVHDALYTRMTVMVREPVRFLLLLAFALALQFWLAMAFLLFAALVWLVGGQVASHFRRQGRLATHKAGERLTIMRESLMMMRLVKCYIMEAFNQARVERQLSIYAKTTMVRLRGEAIYQPLLVFLGLVCILVLLFFAGALVLGGEFSIASVIALATALVCLYWPLEKVLAARRIIRRGQESAANVFKFLDRRGEVGQVVGAEFLPPLSRQIEFDNVTLREPGSSRVLLEEVSLSIAAGSKVGLVGADDLEKHALVYLIPRLLDPTTGEIRIDQHNLRWVTLDSLRAQIGTVLMHNLVFHDTVANNIGCGDNAFTLPQIIETAKIAHAHHFIQKLPQGYETPIGELGHSLSVSEQFRIALARAILRDPALLIIEEPEAALDEDTKSLLDDTYNRILTGRTCIFLPHRISTLRSCDTVFLVHKGRVVASGGHKELLAANQLYRHLHYLEFAEVAEQV